MYLSKDEKENIVNDLVEYFYKPKIRNFVERTNDLYTKYGEIIAEEIMQQVRRIINSGEFINK
ncbi:hypothetical protein P4679_25920 [Priestia megaterium]|uniref:hypothetical protein n=1 Tax=Priestia megaterium TaxID=1404 RepID=UPI002E22CDFC|nr:hypothetical protein [Priestia megaterium]